MRSISLIHVPEHLLNEALTAVENYRRSLGFTSDNLRDIMEDFQKRQRDTENAFASAFRVDLGDLRKREGGVAEVLASAMQEKHEDYLRRTGHQVSEEHAGENLKTPPVPRQDNPPAKSGHPFKRFIPGMAPKKRNLSPAARKRIGEAQRKRWAKFRGEEPDGDFAGDMKKVFSKAAEQAEAEKKRLRDIQDRRWATRRANKQAKEQEAARLARKVTRTKRVKPDA